MVPCVRTKFASKHIPPRHIHMVSKDTSRTFFLTTSVNSEESYNSKILIKFIRCKIEQHVSMQRTMFMEYLISKPVETGS